MQRRRAALVAVATIVFGASTAIGLHATGAIPSALAADATVEITDSGYDPTTVTITAGSVVTWANTGTSVHTVTSDTGLFDSGDLAGGADFANLFDTAGTFAYHDTADPTHKGSVIVTAAPPTATGAGTPEPTPPPGTLPPGFGSPSPEPATAAPSPSAPGSGQGDSGSSGPATSILLFVVAAVAIALGIFFARRRRPPSA